jgi:hypothetical protein
MVVILSARSFEISTRGMKCINVNALFENNIRVGMAIPDIVV